jgi:hypothetical protein
VTNRPGADTPRERCTPAPVGVGTGGAGRLRAAVRRLGRALDRRVPFHPPEPPGLDAPPPISEWGVQAEQRLQALERKLSNQNRLLLFSLVAIVADVIARVLTRSGP